jgi:5'-nucleotidase
MKILLTNDDGIDAPGLRALYEELRPLGEVAVSAPDRQYSAASHSISLHQPFRVRRSVWPGVEHSYSVSSSPADCVRLAILKLLPFKPDWVLSGINQGANYGTLVLYSGTVAAAAEAVILGLPAMAVSVASHTFQDFRAASRLARLLAQSVGKQGLPEGILLNVNVPPLAPEEVKGVVLCHQGHFRHVDDLEPHGEMEDHYGYVLDSPTRPEREAPDSDVERVRSGFIAVSPLQLDLTDRERWPVYRRWGWEDLSKGLSSPERD